MVESDLPSLSLSAVFSLSKNPNSKWDGCCCEGAVTDLSSLPSVSAPPNLLCYKTENALFQKPHTQEIQPTAKPSLVVNRGTASYINLPYNCCHKTYSHLIKLFSRGLLFSAQNIQERGKNMLLKAHESRTKTTSSRLLRQGQGTEWHWGGHRQGRQQREPREWNCPKSLRQATAFQPHIPASHSPSQEVTDWLKLGTVFALCTAVLPHILLSQTPKVKTFISFLPLAVFPYNSTTRSVKYFISN